MAVKQTASNRFRTSTLIALILLIVGIAGIFIFLLPSREEFEKSNNSLTQKQSELSLLKTQLVQFEEVESAFEGGEVTRKDILNLIPEDPNQDQVIEILAETATENEVSLNSLSFGIASSSEADVQVLTITMNASGSHTNLIKFLDGIETSGRKFKVNTISVQVLENRLENMSINMEAYFL